MIKTTSMLLDDLKAYASPKTKLSRMVKNGECFPITKGLYETDRNVPGYLLAGSIYGPSYISFEFALSYYDLIPEAVYTVTCACFEKKKKKQYENIFGRFTYRDVPADAFPYGIALKNEGEYWYRIAVPEKALCDKLYTLPPVKNTKELYSILIDGMRIEEDALAKLDITIVSMLKEKYHSTNVNKLWILLKRMQRGTLKL